MLAASPQRYRAQRGFTLLEVLIAVVVLSIGLLGLAGLQLSGLKASQDAYVRSQATLFAQDIIERMRANRGPALDGDYETGFGERASDFNDSPLAAEDLGDWKGNIEAELPSGKAAIGFNDTIVTIQIRWQERAVDNAGASTSTFTTETQL